MKSTVKLLLLVALREEPWMRYKPFMIPRTKSSMQFTLWLRLFWPRLLKNRKTKPKPQTPTLETLCKTHPHHLFSLTRHPKPPLQSRLSPLEPPLRTIPSLDLLLRDPKQNQQPANQTQTYYVTVADVQAILRQERTRKIPPTLPDPNVLPPYPLEITKTPYPEGYTTPKFQRFDGKNGNAQEHVVRFIETLGAHGGNHTLRLREFSKSLTERAYSWVVNLPPQSVPTWEDMVAKFHAKFFQVSEKVTTLTQ